jgi:hypothetical protein
MLLTNLTHLMNLAIFTAHAFPSSNTQNTLFPHIPYNNISPTRIYQSQFHYFHPSPHVAPVAPQVIPLPLKGRKRKSKAAGRGGGGGKRQRVPAPIVAEPSSTVCGAGPAIPATSLSSITEEEKAAQEAEDQARDLCTVRNELRRYKEEPPPPDDVPLDLVRYWNVSFVHAALDIVLN